jgi:hypothetical protein
MSRPVAKHRREPSELPFAGAIDFDGLALRGIDTNTGLQGRNARAMRGSSALKPTGSLSRV